MMGTWGPGNLDSDNARDFFGNYIDSLGKIIDGLVTSKENVLRVFDENSDEGHIMVIIEIIITLCHRYRTSPLFQPHDVERWRDIYLEAFDEYAVDSGYGSFAKERRPVIEETFEKLRQIVIEYNK